MCFCVFVEKCLTNVSARVSQTTVVHSKSGPSNYVHQEACGVMLMTEVCTGNCSHYSRDYNNNWNEQTFKTK